MRTKRLPQCSVCRVVGHIVKENSLDSSAHWGVDRWRVENTSRSPTWRAGLSESLSPETVHMGGERENWGALFAISVQGHTWYHPSWYLLLHLPWSSPGTEWAMCMEFSFLHEPSGFSHLLLLIRFFPPDCLPSFSSCGTSAYLSASQSNFELFRGAS